MLQKKESPGMNSRMGILEKAIAFLNQEADKLGASGRATLCRRLGASKSSWYRVLDGEHAPNSRQLCSWLDELGASLILPGESRVLCEHSTLEEKIKVLQLELNETKRQRDEAYKLRDEEYKRGYREGFRDGREEMNTSLDSRPFDYPYNTPNTSGESNTSNLPSRREEREREREKQEIDRYIMLDSMKAPKR